jgi:hypothetical protein
MVQLSPNSPAWPQLGPGWLLDQWRSVLRRQSRTFIAPMPKGDGLEPVIFVAGHRGRGNCNQRAGRRQGISELPHPALLPKSWL